MPSAQGRVVPLEFNRGASSYLPPFVDPTASAHNLRIGWLRQVFGSISNEDTASITPSPTSGSGEGSTTVGTHSQSSATSGVVRTSTRTAAQTTRLDTRRLTPTGTIPLTAPSETDSPSDTDTRTTESSRLSRPSLATKSRSSSTTGRRRSSSKPSPSRSRSTSTSRRITTRTFTLLPKSSPSISYTTTPIRTASPSHSSSRSRSSLDTEVSSSSCSHTPSASDSVASLTATLVTSLSATTTIWITLPTTVSITITSSIPTSIPIPIPTTMSTFPSTSSSPPTTLPGDPFSTSSDPITLPGSVSSSGALSSTSYSSSVTDSSSSSPSSFSSTSTSSGSVLQQQTTTATTTTVPVPRTTLFTTVVKTSMTVNSGRTSTRTTTEVVPTGTLMPDTSGASNIFARDKGALAGLILGCIALAGLIVAWALFAYRRHRVRSAQNADAVAALRSGPGRTRAVMLDEEDDEDGHAADMAFLGAGPVSRTSGGVRYARLRGGNHLEGAAEDGSGTRRQDVSGGAAVGFASASIPRGLDEEMEDAVLMHPSNRDFDVTPAGVSNGSSLGSQDRASAGNSSPGAGLGPVKWLGGQVASPDPTTAGYFDGAVHDNLSERPASPSSVYSDEVMSGHSIVGAIGAYIGSEQLAYGRDNYVSSSTQGHGATESSFGGHGSSNDDKIGGSSSGDVPSSTAHSSQLMLPRPVPASAPSSLLPTKKAPPTSFCDLGDIESASRDADQRRKSGFLERSLRSLRLRSPRTELATRTSAHDPSATPHASIAHLQPQTLDSVPHPLFRSEPAIPGGAAPARTPGLGPLSLGLHARTASGAPVWPGLGFTAGRPDAPSPAPTEGSTRTPDGLLNPKWLNGDGMRSQGVISFRDDMDYSRPIGGWVNNRQRSCTTLNTVSPTGSQCRHSLESQQTDGPHMHTQPVPIPHDEEHSTPSRYEELSRPPPLIEITSPPASSR